jgi:proteasome accessory factor B
MTARRAATRRTREHISFEVMAARRAERLVNLVICLLSTRQYLTAERIRDAVPGYEAPDGSPQADEAFKRMFERDKAELRDLGIPLETGRNSLFDTDDGYRITRREYELPPLHFTAAESAAVGLAARLWQSATLGAPARSALLKLRAGGTDVDATSAPGGAPHVDAGDPALPALLEAARTGRAVRFQYQKSGSGAPERRTLEPWGVLSWRRRWYVAGHDRDRDEPRSFRLSRIVGDVALFGPTGGFARPEGINLTQLVAGRSPDPAHIAHIRITGPNAGQLRRLADDLDSELLSINFTDLQWLARVVASAGRSAQVLDPPELVQAVRRRLESVVGART